MNRQSQTQIAQSVQSTTLQSDGFLQRKCASCGNHTVAGSECVECGKNKRLSLQTKLKINEPGDIYEQEADRVAEQVMTTPAHHAVSGVPPRIQRFSGQSNGQMDAVPVSVNHALASPGRPLEPALRQDMEQRFSHDFSRVRVHSGATAELSARDVNAHAYTIGHSVVFGAGRFAPGTQDGRRLLAHELTHVVQQSGADGIRVGQSNGERGLPPIGPCAPLSGAVVQRKPDAPAKTTAAGGPKLDFRLAKNPPPCACIVFMHHNEPNARLTAQAMYEFCHYNLAIVGPQTNERKINLPGKGLTDPNELFPRKVAEECWADDKPCEDFLSKNAGATNDAVVEEYAQRQFFLAIKKCSDGFSLPVVGLHNNTIKDTARYRTAVRHKKSPLDLTPIKGKTFDDALKAGDKSDEVNILPFADLQEWLLKNAPGVKEKEKPKGTKGKLETPTTRKEENILTTGKTNIFLWCSAEDISRCQIGDPERPDNVVWVTNTADFKKLQGTKTNVVLQTRVDPAGRSATDLSSLFVFLKEIVGAHFSDLIIKSLLLRRPLPGLLNALLLKRRQRHFINIETPQSPYDATTKPEDLRVQSYRDVKATLAAIGFDCCDVKPAEGETENAVEKVEKALREGKLPKV